MSLVADSVLFDGDFSTAAVSHLMHLPETIEKLVVFPSPSTHDRRRRHHHQQSQQQEKGTGGVPVDILETSKAYTFFLDVPGLSKSDVQVAVEDESVLVIRSNGKRKREEEGEEEGEEEEGCKYLRLERKASSRRKFLRKFGLPEDSDASAISARCENGVLTVTVGKRPPPEAAAKPKTVEVAIA